MVRVGHSLLVTLILTTAATAAEPAWSLPDNPQAVVLELRYAKPAANAPETKLELRRDGTFIGDKGTARRISGRLSNRELQELMGEIVVDSGALQLTSSGLSRQIQEQSRRTGKSARLTSGVDTIIRITLADGAHELQCVSPEVLRTRYPALRELDRVCAIRRRLENVVAVAHAGGKPAAERLAALATEQLRRHNGAQAQVTARDLQAVRGEAGDLRQAQFVITDASTGSPAGSEVHISVFESPGAPPRIRITTSAKPL